MELVCRDILAALALDSALYDVVYTSFALHHLSTEQKAEFFRRVAQRLEKDGLLLLQALAQAGGLGYAVAVARYGWHRVLCFRRRGEETSPDLAIHPRAMLAFRKPGKRASGYAKYSPLTTRIYIHILLVRPKFYKISKPCLNSCGS